MTLSPLGAAIKRPNLDALRDWLFDSDRPIEIQDFVFPEVIAGDTAELVQDYREALTGHRGPRGIHGPFFGLDLANPDREIRAIIQRRFLKGTEIAEALGADQMVIHSPFTYWHTLNYMNYPHLREALFSACIECLQPVLDRARDAGCILVLENIDDTDPKDRVELVAKIDHPSLKVSVDTGHAELAHQRYGAPALVDFIAAAGPNLGHVHLQDVDGYADRHWHPGEGRISWAPVLDEIERIEPSPRLILEVRSRLDRLPATAEWLETKMCYRSS
jgi:sugar phosphate isomerase/epimerase